MAMTFDEIMTTYYADYFKQGLFKLRNNNGQIEIYNWIVPNVSQPSYDEVMALDTPELEYTYQVMQFFATVSPVLQQFIDSVAILRGYGNSLYCMSYFNSSIPQWSTDAHTFNSWRDSVWTYIEAQKVLIANGSRPIPTDISILVQELPEIVWSEV